MIKLSACVIVRDEERNLPRWLECMRKLADEMVVVDTGSKDKTVELAKAAGARMFHFPWCNDFAAAKNYAINQAKGQWILLLDADEYWEPTDFPIIRKTLREHDKCVDIIGFVCRMVNLDVDNHNRVLNENMHIRIMRNLPKLRFKGAVHEQLVYEGADKGNKKMILLPQAVIYHTGYSASTDVPKARRNLEILLAQQAAGRGKDEDICYITDCYYSLKEYAQAADSARKAITQKVILPGRETRMYDTLIQCEHILGTPWQNLLSLVEQAEKDFPYVPDFRALLGFAAWDDGDKEAARQFFWESKALYKEFQAHRQDDTATFPDEMTSFLPRIDSYLAEEKDRMRNVRISATVIVKNEEEDIVTWIRCMQDLAEEIVVVDTGSTDRTVEIVQEAGIKVMHFDWIDDFAAAKNFALDQVHGDWVLFMDADEYIPQEYYDGLKKAIARYDADSSVIGLVSDWVNVDKVNNNAYTSKGYQIRVFRNMPELRYVHMIHELLQYRGEGKKTMPYVEDFKIYHTGYSSGRMPGKFKRNLRLLLLSQEKYGPRPEDNMYLADCYFGLKDYEKTIDYAKAYLDGTGRMTGGENRPYGIWIKSLMLLKRPLSEIVQVVERALGECPYSSEFKILEGFARYGEKDYIGAERCYREAIKMYTYAQEHNELQKDLLTEEAGAIFINVYLDLSTMLLWQGKEAEAWDFLQQAMAMDKYKARCVSLLGKLLAEQDDLTWIEVLNKIYDKQQDADFIMANLPSWGRDKVRLYYMRQQADNNPTENYLAVGRLEAAGASVCEDTAALLQLVIRGFSHETKGVENIGLLMPKDYRAVTLGHVQTAEQRKLAAKTARVQNWLAQLDGWKE